MRKFHKMIEEICIENDVQFQLLSKDWVCLLEKENKTRYIAGYKFDLNGHGLGNVVDDKYAFYEVLTKKNYPTITHHIVFRQDRKEKIKNLFDQYEHNVVVKSNTGTCGSEVFHIQELEVLLN